MHRDLEQQADLSAEMQMGPHSLLAPFQTTSIVVIIIIVIQCDPEINGAAVITLACPNIITTYVQVHLLNTLFIDIKLK